MFTKFLGNRPARLGLVSTMYDEYTIGHLTEAIFNTYTLDKGNKNAWQRLDSFMVEWDIESKRIKRLPILEVQGDGLYGGDVLFTFGENYYQKFDTFIVERTRQQFIVLQRPQRLSDAATLVVAKILDDDYNSMVDVPLTDQGLVGETTRFVTNYHPEMHEEGYTKYQSNLEKHRTYIATHRNDIDMSAQYNAYEDVFIQIAKGSEGGKDDPIFHLTKGEQVCLENFLAARNNANIWGKSNMDIHGRPKHYDPETGRPIITADGVIAQIERFATKFVFSKLNHQYFIKALNVMVSKSEKATGNHYMFLCNSMLWQEIQNVLMAYIRDWKTVGTFVFSKAKNGYVELGATYQSYEFAGKLPYCLP